MEINERKQHKEQLIKAYTAAGENFLAYKLEPLFTLIETEEDRVRHNDILKELLMMIEGKQVFFMKITARSLMKMWKSTPKRQVKKALALCIARKIFETR